MQWYSHILHCVTDTTDDDEEIIIIFALQLHLINKTSCYFMLSANRKQMPV